MKTFKEYLKDILVITDYKGDVEALISKAENNIYFEAFLNLSGKLGTDNKNKIIKIIETNPGNTQVIAEILKSNFPDQVIVNEIEAVSKNFIDGLMNNLATDLDSSQREKLMLMGYDIRDDMRRI